MKFRILVKQNKDGLVPVYYPQFRCWGIWCYYLPHDDVLKHCGFFFRADAEKFLMDRFKAQQKEHGATSIIPWKPYQ